MTSRVCTSVLGWLLVMLVSENCITKTEAYPNGQDYSTASQDYRLKEVGSPPNPLEDESLRKLLILTSKRFNSQSFFPARGKKAGLVDPRIMGFSGTRGRRSLVNLSRVMSPANKEALLRRLYPELAEEPSPKSGGNKRLNSDSYFGVRGKRPVLNEDMERQAVLASDAYTPPDELDTEFTQSLTKRQPPPGFYALRGR